MLDRNAIVRGLDKESEQLILAKCELVHLVLRQPIYAPEEPITDVYFPIDAIISIVSRMHDGQQIEIGTIGREGMSAFPLLMGASSTANESFCQVPGAAVRMPTAVFRALNASNNVMRQRLDRYLQAYVNMLGQLAACNRLHSIYERCSRWLLMSRGLHPLRARCDHDRRPARARERHLRVLRGRAPAVRRFVARCGRDRAQLGLP
jgi:CRP-like cAMP-binding protein